MIDAFMGLSTSQRWLFATLTGLLVFVVWFHYRRGAEYDVLDILIDQQTRRASFDAHVTLIFAALALWWVIDQTEKGEDVGGRLIEILMIFVIYRGAKQAIAAYQNRPQVVVPPIPDPPSVTVNQNAGGVNPKPDAAAHDPPPPVTVPARPMGKREARTA